MRNRQTETGMVNCSNILIVSDLDGTFLGKDGKTVPRNMEAVARFMQCGGLFSFATGRVHTTIEQFVLPHYREMINAPAVMCNGACVFDPVHDRILHEELLDGRAIRPIVREVLQRFAIAHTNIYAGPDYFCYQDTPPELIQPDDWHKVVFVAEPDEILRLHAWADKNSRGIFRFFRSADFLCEFLSVRAGKGEMLRRLREDYAKQGRRLVTYGIGDYENDLDLIEAADHGACPANAFQPVRERAEIVLSASNEEGAVAELIEIAMRSAERNGK